VAELEGVGEALGVAVGDGLFDVLDGALVGAVGDEVAAWRHGATDAGVACRIAEMVVGPTIPSAVRFTQFWKAFTAVSVSKPRSPSS
jgi:hypothetical protein